MFLAGVDILAQTTILVIDGTHICPVLVKLLIWKARCIMTTSISCGP
jgi:hypothetical protein